jgi:hypothetical protein
MIAPLVAPAQELSPLETIVLIDGGSLRVNANKASKHYNPDFIENSYSASRCIDRIVLVTNDTDCVPAMKYGRKAGLQTVIIELPKAKPAPEFVMAACCCNEKMSY